MLFAVTPDDPATLLAACLLLTAIAALATFMPARRASRLDPVAAMRQD
jgi:ABC-type lipoprotein release transport system permease subunit